MACRKCYRAWRRRPRDADFFARNLLAERRKTEEAIKKTKLDKLDSMLLPKKSNSEENVGLSPTRKNVRKIRWLWHRGEAWKLIVRPGLYGSTCKESQPGEVSCSGI